jgi:hypothetical protein
MSCVRRQVDPHFSGGDGLTRKLALQCAPESRTNSRMSLLNHPELSFQVSVSEILLKRPRLNILSISQSPELMKGLRISHIITLQVASASTLLTCSWSVPGSNLGRGIPVTFSSFFVVPICPGEIHNNWPWIFFSPFHHVQLTARLTKDRLQSNTFWEIIDAFFQVISSHHVYKQTHASTVKIQKTDLKPIVNVTLPFLSTSSRITSVCHNVAIVHSRRRESHRKQMYVVSPSLLEWNHAAITWCVYRCRGVQSLNAR